MISNADYLEAYVWVWLPEATDPVVAGRLYKEGDQLRFNYGKSYLARLDAISLYDQELPLVSGALPLRAGLDMPSCIRDAAPDAWGRRVLLNRLLGAKGRGADVTQVSELSYLLHSGSDRIGALDFQRSPTEYVPRLAEEAPLEELMESVERVEKGIVLTQELDQALHHGSSIGGARPKVLIVDDSKDKKYIAKFSSSSDFYSVVKAEFIAMRLAALAGLDVASVLLAHAGQKDVLLIERFDRVKVAEGWQRKLLISALTLLQLSEMEARYASYEDLAEKIRHYFAAPKATLRELFVRMVFNVLCGNTDDHARNHAAFWDGEQFMLTPAYDICPQARSGHEASQAMFITGQNRMSTLANCRQAASSFLLSQEEADSIIEHQVEVIKTHWELVCDEAKLTQVDREMLWGRSFLNPYCFD